MSALAPPPKTDRRLLARAGEAVRSLTSFRRGDGRLLVVEVDGRRALAAIVQAVAGRVVIDSSAHVDGATPEAAVEEAVKKLEKPPREAILLLAEAIPTCLSIPVDPAKPIAREKLSALIRYEMETDLAMQARGDHAADLVVGFAPSGARASAPGSHLWLACGLSRATRDRWAGVFEEAGHELSAIYPLASAAAAGAEGTGTVVQLGRSVVGRVRLRDGFVDSVSLFAPQSREISTEGLRGSGPLVVSGPDDLTGPLAEALGALNGRPTVTASGAIAGAARHALRLEGGARTVPLLAREPPVPLHRRPVAPIALAIVLAILGVCVGEVAIARSLSRARDDLHAAELDAARLPGPSSPTVEAQLKKDMGDLRARRSFLEEDVGHRDALVRALLDALAESVSEEVALDRVEEVDPDRFHVTGFALDENGAQRFARELGSRMAPRGLSVGGLSIHEQTGRLGLLGYAFELTLGGAA